MRICRCSPLFENMLHSALQAVAVTLASPEWVLRAAINKSTQPALVATALASSDTCTHHTTNTHVSNQHLQPQNQSPHSCTRPPAHPTTTHTMSPTSLHRFIAGWLASWSMAMSGVKFGFGVIDASAHWQLGGRTGDVRGSVNAIRHHANSLSALETQRPQQPASQPASQQVRLRSVCLSN